MNEFTRTKAANLSWKQTMILAILAGQRYYDLNGVRISESRTLYTWTPREVGLACGLYKDGSDGDPSSYTMYNLAQFVDWGWARKIVRGEYEITSEGLKAAELVREMGVGASW